MIPAVSYDHPDIYPSREDYEKAFWQFESQSRIVAKMGTDGAVIVNQGKMDYFDPDRFALAGEVRRRDAALAAVAVDAICRDVNDGWTDVAGLIDVLNTFPGVGRRFERIKDGLYSDYAHHPEEIKATMNVALEEARIRGKRGVVVIYQPHQNVRQHEVREGYRDAFSGASRIYWLPTYLTREDPDLAVISPAEFIRDLSNSEVAEVVELTDELRQNIRHYLNDGYLVIMMTAGPADGWLRTKRGVVA